MKQPTRNIGKAILFVLSLVSALAVTGCKSYWVDVIVQNETGHRIQQLEVAYPSASFGNNFLAPGASMHYRFQIRNSGPVKVDFTQDDGKTTHAQGLNLVEHQGGQLTIRLLPEGKVQFVPNLQPAS
jgi:hypothetical protein